MQYSTGNLLEFHLFSVQFCGDNPATGNRVQNSLVTVDFL